jgi:hypothetical protein
MRAAKEKIYKIIAKLTGDPIARIIHRALRRRGYEIMKPSAKGK